MYEKMMKLFQKIYGDAKGVRVFFAPGRVNLIGEHTDYNGGHVFPCALTLGTYGAIRKREDNEIRLYSENFPEDGILLGKVQSEKMPEKLSKWGDYVLGTLWAYAQEGAQIEKGFDFCCYGTIPNKSGLSSSASLEVLTGKCIESLYGVSEDGKKRALLGQKAENQFVGVNCGIMDQFACSMGKENQGIFLDTAVLEYEYVEIPMKDSILLICNTNKKRELSDSKYNERRAECEEALGDLQKKLSLESLGDLTLEEFEKNRGCIQREVCAKRAKHAVSENRRAMEAVQVLRQGNLLEFGQLMKESHLSLEKDYEVTGKELDTLVYSAWKQPGVIGARMTGAGFGGCAVVLLEKDAVDSFVSQVGEEYEKAMGYPASFYPVSIGGGPREIK